MLARGSDNAGVQEKGRVIHNHPGREGYQPYNVFLKASKSRKETYAQIVRCGAGCGDVGVDASVRAFSGVGTSGEVRRSHFRKMDDGPDQVREQSPRRPRHVSYSAHADIGAERRWPSKRARE